ncbi:hypothetical protein [Sphingomonas radiodurans]|uniref:hypothetical protein n=1 Tax=Sphingomonas radiodurans TaxID=2890321 RepID=UPI001E6461B7|nr:hypothetical protein [Sphingomonas radiodurans]WBH17043.1 hypothetical protein LLW23_02675 [Sphingomonas radiodurans]
MARIITRESAAAKPLRIALAGVPVDWTTILEANDFSVPDTSVRWPGVANRDPANADRRIQPGFALIEAPLMFHNTDVVERRIDIRILTEDAAEVVQARITIPAGDTYMHPAPGQRLLKLTLASASGDRLQVRAEVAGVIHLTAAASEGAAEQHQPSGV